MKLVCPHCAKVIEVADALAGQTAHCEFCQGPFTVPVPQPDSLPPPPPPPPAPPPTAAPANGGGGFRLDDTLPHPGSGTESGHGPQPGPTAQRPASGAGAKATETAKAAAAAVLKGLSGVALKQPGKVILRCDPAWLGWIPPIGLIALFVLLFFPWLTFEVGGSPLILQRGYSVAFGSLATSADLPGIKGTLTSSSVAVYFLLSLVALAAAVGLLFLKFAPDDMKAKVGPWPGPLLEHRKVIMFGLTASGFLCVALQSLFSFPLQSDLVGGKAETAVASGLRQALDGEFRVIAERADALASDFFRIGFGWRLTQWISLFITLVALGDWLLHRSKIAGKPKLEIGWGMEKEAAEAPAA